LKTTRYFEEQVLRKRPYIKREWCRDVLANPIRREVQDDGRVRYWGKIMVEGEARPRFRRGGAMKLHYYPETDSLYIELKTTPGTETREIVEGLVVDLDENGEVVGFDIDHASRKLDLSKIETIALPPASAAE
jgi:uncharacterized protein YuzE